MRGAVRAAGWTLGAVAVAALSWEASGWLLAVLRLDELDLPGRCVGLFAGLTLAERLLARLGVADAGDHGE